MEQKRYRLRFYGQVQGVGFRYTATHLAQRYRLTGWVRNEYDGSVSAEIQGEDASISEWLKAIHCGRYIEIDRMDKTEIEIYEDERSFGVKY